MARSEFCYFKTFSQIIPAPDPI